jgi:hypothetical protein
MLRPEHFAPAGALRDVEWHALTINISHLTALWTCSNTTALPNSAPNQYHADNHIHVIGLRLSVRAVSGYTAFGHTDENRGRHSAL